MKLWIGTETQSDVVELFLPIRLDVQNKINAVINNYSYDIGSDDWDCIVILQDVDTFNERIRFSKAKRDMDFRLHMDYAEFLKGDEETRKRQLLKLLLRSLQLLKEKGGNSAAIDDLISEVIVTGKDNSWL